MIIASKGGAPTHPQWYFNMVANPQVTVELPSETYEARVVLADCARTLVRQGQWFGATPM